MKISMLISLLLIAPIQSFAQLHSALSKNCLPEVFTVMQHSQYVVNSASKELLSAKQNESNDINYVYRQAIIGGMRELQTAVYQNSKAKNLSSLPRKIMEAEIAILTGNSEGKVLTNTETNDSRNVLYEYRINKSNEIHGLVKTMLLHESKSTILTLVDLLAEYNTSPATSETITARLQVAIEVLTANPYACLLTEELNYIRSRQISSKNGIEPFDATETHRTSLVLNRVLERAQLKTTELDNLFFQTSPLSHDDFSRWHAKWKNN